MATPSYYNLAHNTSLHFEENNAPSEPGAKHLSAVQEQTIEFPKRPDQPKYA
jgi:hypothetical protein